jgi:hypothetical protein
MEEASEEAGMKEQRQRKRANDGEKKQKPGEGHRGETGLAQPHTNLPDGDPPARLAEHFLPRKYFRRANLLSGFAGS